MTLAKLYEEAARVAKIIEGTDLKMHDVVKYSGENIPYPNFYSNRNEYEFALAIVEGKPVFKGDVLWNVPNNFKFTADRSDYIGGVQRIIGGSLCAWLEAASWNPPKPKTVMVELLREDAEQWAQIDYDKSTNIYKAISKACRKALEE
jgi:hypothetical protein